MTIDHDNYDVDNNPVDSIESALAKLHDQSLKIADGIEPPKAPVNGAQVIAANLTAVFGRAIYDAVSRSQALRHELQNAEEALIASLQDMHEITMRKLQHGESLFRVAEFVRDELKAAKS